MSDLPGSKDLADIDVNVPPPGWKPDTVDAIPAAADVRDLNQEPNS